MKMILRLLKKRFSDKIIYVEQNKDKFSDIKEIINVSIQTYKELRNKNLPKYVLHGDLQHKNILNMKIICKFIMGF